MPSPFPGMDPYLEAPFFWHQVHSRLIVALSNDLGRRLRPKYYAAIETRTYLEDGPESIFVGIPDAIVFSGNPVETSPQATATLALPIAQPLAQPLAQPQKVRLVEPIEVKERYLEIRKVGSHEVIAAIEVLSPRNKQGIGRKIYLDKRQRLLETASHFVEIDLLRVSQPIPVVGTTGRSDYRILVSPAGDRPNADLYSFNLRDQIPIFPLPLRAEDALIPIDLGLLLQGVYEEGCFDLQIDYRQPVPEPVLSKQDLAWVEALVRSGGDVPEI